MFCFVLFDLQLKQIMFVLLLMLA